MATPLHRITYSLAEYVTLETTSNVKHEYFDGQIFAMAGGSPEHAAIGAAVIGLLYGALRTGPCRPYDSDLRVRIRETGLITYPDVTVICGPRELDAEDPQAVTNPTLIVEVLSASTESYDRTDKFDHYKRLLSLKQYVLVSLRERRIDVHTRAEDGSWSSVISNEGEQASLSSVSASLNVSEVLASATSD